MSGETLPKLGVLLDFDISIEGRERSIEGFSDVFKRIALNK